MILLWILFGIHVVTVLIAMVTLAKPDYYPHTTTTTAREIVIRIFVAGFIAGWLWFGYLRP